MNTVEIRSDSQADGPEAGFAGSGGGINETRRAGDGEKARIRRLEVPVGPGGVDGPVEVENDLNKCRRSGYCSGQGCSAPDFLSCADWVMTPENAMTSAKAAGAEPKAINVAKRNRHVGRRR